MTSLSQSTCYNSSLTEAPLWLRLPIELHMLIFSYCDYFTLKQIQRVCKFFKPLLDTTYLNSEIFWPTPEPLSGEDLLKIANKYKDKDRFTFRLHPIIQDSSWCTNDADAGPVLLGSDVFCADEDIPLVDLAIRDESATFPAVSCMADIVVSMWRHGSAPLDPRLWMGEELVGFHIKESKKTLYRTVTVQDVMQLWTQMEDRWKTRLGWKPNNGLFRLRSYPDATFTAARLDPHGWVDINTSIYRSDPSDDKPI
ncbi:hypothetical protein A4X09_0g7404 [Tilletia walkeri]|uniref:F-box domain-containing protein n=1 Tax=Tilletia walkeri TaxID=117179 RepID=A0A8X7N0V0_9BASI|nr:hypothetical protein A4X09_0g7404 [Tilletia walkeri]